MNRTLPKNKSYGHQPQKEDIPLLFGANFHDDPVTRSTLRKSHATAMDIPPGDDYSPHTSYNFSGLPASTSAQSANALVQQKMSSDFSAPKDDASTVVLRFLAFFRESVPESPDERTRVRKVAILFHPADNTMAVREAHQPNSGMNQGPFLKRQVVIKSSDGSPITTDDLNIGKTVLVFGRELHIVDADEAARRYYKEVLGCGMPDLPLPWPTEEDAFNAKTSAKLAMKEPKKRIPTTDMDFKRALESLHSGGIVSKHAPDDIRIAQQFHMNKINEHLQFAALWDDRKRMSGDLRLVVLRYFLENDTIEVVEKRDENCGREGGNKLLLRQRAPKDPTKTPTELAQLAQQSAFGVLLKRDYLTWQDISVGAYVTLYGHHYYVYDADTFTREWYEKKGATLADAIDVTDIITKYDKPVPLQYPPPHNGFGSEEDSLMNWKHLSVRPHPVDFAKVEREEGKVMTFAAEFAPPTEPEDHGRRFSVKFYPVSDEVEINEMQVRNSGIVGGKFLAKGRHLRTLQDGRRIKYTREDFLEALRSNTPIVIAGRSFVLSQLDSRSQRQLDGITDSVSEERVRELIVLFRELLHSKFYSSHQAYRALAPEGTMTMKEIREFMRKSSCQITEEEALHLVAHFAPTGNGVVMYEQFIKIMDVGLGANMDEATNHPRSIKNIQLDVPSDLKKAATDAATLTHRRRLRKMLVEKLTERRGTVQEVYRMLAGHAFSGRMTKAPFLTGLHDQLHLLFTPQEQEIVLEMVFGESEELTFPQFYKFVESADTHL